MFTFTFSSSSFYLTQAAWPIKHKKHTYIHITQKHYAKKENKEKE